jgi:hypothetical protein
MKLQEKSLIIIPGLGDRTRTYNLVTAYWKLFGYNVCIFSFGWEDTSDEFTSALNRLVRFIDERHAPVNIIGVSAGGTAAMNALALRPHKINKIVTIATPYTHPSPIKNTKLRSSLDRLKNIKLEALNTKVLSIHGLYDQTVPVIESKPRGIRTQGVFAARHVIIIALTLTLYSSYIRRFFKNMLS